MDQDRYIMQKVEGITVNNKNIPMSYGFLETANKGGVKYVTLYFTVADTETGEEKKMKCKFIGRESCFSEVDEDEWDSHCKK